MSDQEFKNKYYELKNLSFGFFVQDTEGVTYFFDSEELFLKFLNNNYEIGLTSKGEICIKNKVKGVLK